MKEKLKALPGKIWAWLTIVAVATWRGTVAALRSFDHTLAGTSSGLPLAVGCLVAATAFLFWVGVVLPILQIPALAALIVLVAYAISVFGRREQAIAEGVQHPGETGHE